MNILSLFDGMSCGQLALQRADIPVENYLVSEIDKYAIQVTQKNFPYTIQLGDITKIDKKQIELLNKIGIDLVIGGSPCQGFSFAGKQLNFKDPRSKLFFEFSRILKAIKPKYFLLENVRMKKENQDIISEYMGVEPIAINSNLVSAQNRHRLYWTNIPFNIPDDKGIILANILEDKADEKYRLSEAKVNRVLNTKRGKGFFYDKDSKKIGTVIAGYHKEPTDGSYIQEVTGGAFRGRYKIDGVRQDHKGSVAGKTQQELEVRTDGKTNALTTVQKDNVAVIYQKPRGYNKGGVTAASIKDGKTPSMTPSSWQHNNFLVKPSLSWRKLTPIECERLQTVPDNYTDSVSNTQRYKMLGNGMTVDVIAHILKGIKADD
tara:strand:- start:882 stop:2009 length:1128 start_codon:yes stop_codon:yes gene_type:complete